MRTRPPRHMLAFAVAFAVAFGARPLPAQEALAEALEVTRDLVLDKDAVLARPLVIRASHVTIEGNGATIRGPGKAGDPKSFVGTGISASGCSDVTIRDVSVAGFRIGLAASDGDHWTLERCDLSHNFHDPDFGWGDPGRGGGIVLARIARSLVRGCRANEDWNALDLVECDDDLVTGCNLSHASNTCVRLTTSRRNTFLDNDLSYGLRIAPGETHARDSACVLVESGSDGNSFVGNDITHGGDGVFVRLLSGWVSRGNRFLRNDCSFAHNNCVECWSPQNEFVDNKANHGSYGFWMAGSHELRLIGNEVAWNGAPDGFHSATEPGFGNAGIVMAGVSASHVVIEGNRIHHNAGAGIAFRGDDAAGPPAWRIRHWIVQQNRIESNRCAIWGRRGDAILLADNVCAGNAEEDHFDDVTGLVRVGGDPAITQPPRAVLVAPRRARVGEALLFDATRSTGAAERPLAFELDLAGTVVHEARATRTFDRPGLYSIGLTVRDGPLAALAACDLIVAAPVAHELGTEGEAARWGFEMEGNEDGRGRILFDDDDDAVVGRRALRFRPDPYKGMYATAIFPAARDLTLDITQARSVSFWIRTENPNAGGFQNPGPVLHLYSRGGELALAPSKGRNLMLTPACNEERWNWSWLRVPLRDDPDWSATRRGDFDPAHVAALGIALDSWGNDPFTVWLDGLALDAE